MSEWEDIYKGVPQGSILDPVLFNIFINDIFYFIQESSLYNYADNNTLEGSQKLLTNP
jgi:retron-type reverse transcriptase